MKRPPYRLKDGLTGMPQEARLLLIDELLDADMSDGEQRRELLIDHELLAAHAEFFLRYSTLVEDGDGHSYMPLKGGSRAYGLDDFIRYLERDTDHLSHLTGLIRDALFARFIEDLQRAE